MITRQDVIYLYAEPGYRVGFLDLCPDFLNFAIFTIDKSRAERILGLRAGLFLLQDVDKKVLRIEASDVAPLLYGGARRRPEDEEDGCLLLELPEQNDKDRALVVTACTLTLEKGGFSWCIEVEGEDGVPLFGMYNYKILEEFIGLHEKGGAK